MALFPSLPLTSLLKGYFTYMSIPLYVGEKEDGDTGQENAPEEPDTGFDMILVCLDLVLISPRYLMYPRNHIHQFPNPSLPTEYWRMSIFLRWTTGTL